MRSKPLLFAPALSLGLAVWLAAPAHAQSSRRASPTTDAADVATTGGAASPFAVSSSGSVRPRAPREVTILGADPVIAEGLARLGRASERLDVVSSPTVRESEDSPPDPADASPPADVAPAAVSQTVDHWVVPGETLWEVARQYDVTPEAIRAANGLEGDRLRPNQMLRIPITAR